MKKILLCCLLVLLVFAVVAQAGEFDDCSYYQKNGRHNYVDDGYERYPDCTQEGIKWVKCVVCGYRGISPVARTDHKFGAWKDILPATENTKGVQSRTCSVCDTVSTQEYYPNGTVYMHRKKDVIADMQQMLVQWQQMALTLAQKYEPAMADGLAQAIMGGSANPAPMTGGQAQGDGKLDLKRSDDLGIKKNEHALVEKARQRTQKAYQP